MFGNGGAEIAHHHLRFSCQHHAGLLEGILDSRRRQQRLSTPQRTHGLVMTERFLNETVCIRALG